MNRYQREVTEMDRRHFRLVRAASVVGAAGLIALAMWSAGVQPTEWLATTYRWWSDDNSSAQSSASSPISVATQTRLAAVAPELNARVNSGTGPGTSVPARPQPLYLVGTTPGRNKQQGTARIGTSRSNPQTYVAGALLVNGARLVEIHRDHVLLERGGNRVELRLHTVARQLRVDDLLVVGGAPRQAPSPPLTREVLIDYMRPSPVFQDEALRGYQVYPGRKAGVFSQLGLRPGDVITSIDDAPILDAVSAIEALKQITNGASVVVRVERNGKPARLVLDGAWITSDLERDKNPVAATPPNDPAGA
jgi:type II secretion system protein C